MQNLTENLLSLCWLSSLSVSQLLSNTFSLMIIVVTVQVSMLGKKTVRKGLSSSIQGIEEFFLRSLPSSNFFLHVEGDLNPFNGWNESSLWFFLNRLLKDCLTLQHVDPAGVSTVAQILMSNSRCQLGAQLSKIRVVVNGPRLMTILTRAPHILWGATRLGQFQN